MKALISLKSVFVLAIVLLATSCHESEGMRSHADLQTMPSDQILTRVMAYVQAHEQQMDFLTERNFSSKDMKVRQDVYKRQERNIHPHHVAWPYCQPSHGVGFRFCIDNTKLLQEYKNILKCVEY